MPVKGLEGLTDPQIEEEVKKGAKFVVFQYCVSIIVMTFRQSSDIHFIKSGESPFMRGLPYTFTSLFLGWWGIPWGPIYTIGAIATNMGGGKDVTKEIMDSVNKK